MPELPEVETIKRGLIGKITNKKIEKIWIEPSFRKKISPSAGSFVDFMVGKSFLGIARRAKILIFSVERDKFLLVHLKLTGQLVFQSKHETAVESSPNKFARVIFYFSDDSRLFFNDMRKFGFLKLTDEKKKDLELKKYGLEPFDTKFTFNYFDDILGRRKNKKIKTILMDQAFIAGVGNIYSDEICFSAGVRPVRLVKSLTKNEKKKIYQQIRRILSLAIKYHGSSVDNYVASDGGRGQFQKLLKVYGRGGEKCRKCGKANIVRIKTDGRSSCYCPRCQK
ncbi:bifunctional DNA-formamidopyrimidine glycosylase/DNA-(apurinic or apyrimidinic site) lyase [Candidatus Falkowbacteria bacterium]|nr:bifunctional DNA-formamidopyrimidine glycosylase/DNA-(apurinic or apyrimidinic site) lyase [Candidatus Falkowbacteria bacterium]